MATVVETVPPLCAGDHLTLPEFLRRWETMPALKRAELLGGVVFMPPPVSAEHGENDFSIAGWLAAYHYATPGTAGASNATLVLAKDVPQPDVLLRLLPECGGSSTVEGKYLRGPVELVVETCQTSAAYDLHKKLDIYRLAGVREYVTILLLDEEIRWHILDAHQYEQMAPDGGAWRSKVFPGLWLDGAAFLAGQLDKVWSTLQQGLASPEHAEFVRRNLELMKGTR